VEGVASEKLNLFANEHSLPSLDAGRYASRPGFGNQSGGHAMAIPAQFGGIDHVVLRVRDLERTLGFYVGVLGLTVERIFEKINLHQVRCGRNLIDIMPLGPSETLAAPAERGIEHLCLNIQGDMDKDSALGGMSMLCDTSGLVS